ncbi:GDT1-like protein 2, chloroplastic [Porphyridium purpureum]|uniref:GDT1 family protein n=1 Tax=Porphyridium purpureum TaxID=35688 RepID=A0A5J4Z1U6_PORPP|nr:GDT1-like protein 2, chloroplastic [Porphyridium purpureum]|eukprot:POR7596..scf208_2
MAFVVGVPALAGRRHGRHPVFESGSKRVVSVDAKGFRARPTRRLMWQMGMQQPLNDPDVEVDVSCGANAEVSEQSANLAVARKTQTVEKPQPHSSLGWTWKAMSRAVVRMLVCTAGGALLSKAFVMPALAMAAGVTGLPLNAELDSFSAGFTSSFLLVLSSEIGDKTFFISALLSLKYAKRLVLVGTLGALSLMTLISVGIGQVFHALPSSLNTSIPLDDYAAVALLVWFGIDNIRSGLAMGKDDADGEKRDAEEAIAEAESEKSKGSRPGWIQALSRSEDIKIIVETFTLIFLAEWGDKSMLTTIALAAAKSPLGVVLGGISGHAIASIIAVVGGSFLSEYLTERNARLIGGVLFLVFAVLTILGIY